MGCQEMKMPTSGTTMQRFRMACLTRREEHLKSQAEGRRYPIHSSSIKPTFQVALLLGGYSMKCILRRPPPLRHVDLLEARFICTSARPPSGQLGDLPNVTTIFPDSGQVGGSSTRRRLVLTSTSWICVPGLDVRLRACWKRDFPF
jgi:hypothetical protein